MTDWVPDFMKFVFWWYLSGGKGKYRDNKLMIKTISDPNKSWSEDKTQIKKWRGDVALLRSFQKSKGWAANSEDLGKEVIGQE